jgi:hypothetical protein
MSQQTEKALSITIDSLHQARKKIRLALQSIESIGRVIEEAEPLPRTLPFAPTEDQLRKAIADSFMSWGSNKGREEPTVIEVTLASYGYTSRLFTADALVREIVSGLNAMLLSGSDSNYQSDDQASNDQSKGSD